MIAANSHYAGFGKINHKCRNNSDNKESRKKINRSLTQTSHLVRKPNIISLPFIKE
jgi:hypothetical protein